MAKKRVMQPKESRKPLEESDIKVGKSYRGKYPAKAGSSGQLNDRTVLHIGQYSQRVQYDSSAVRDRAEYPIVSMEAFLKWASHEVF